MKLFKRPITQAELDQVIQAMYEYDVEFNYDTEYDPDRPEAEAKESIKYYIDKYMPERDRICVENAETHEPICIVLSMDGMYYATWEYAHDEVFIWEDGKLQRFNRNQ